MPKPSSLRPAGVSQDRQKRLLTALLDAGEAGLSRAQMAKLFGGQVRAVERSIVALQTNGAMIEAAFPADGTREKRYVLVQPPDGMAMPTPEACLALRVAEEALRRSGGDGWLELRPSKAPAPDSGLGPKGTQKLARSLERTTVRGTTSPIAEPKKSVLATLVRILAEPFPPRVELAYHALAHDADRIHEVVPHTLVQDAIAGGPYLIAWHMDRQRVMVFRVSRITSIRMIGPVGLPSSARDSLIRAVQLQVGAWTNGEDMHRIRVRITEPRWAIHFLNAVPDLPDASVEPDPEVAHGAIVSFSSAVPEGAVRWVLQMGGGAEVLEPPAIREAVIQELDRAAKRYQMPSARSAWT